MVLANHTPFVPQGVPPVSQSFDLIGLKAGRPPVLGERGWGWLAVRGFARVLYGVLSLSHGSLWLHGG